MIPPGPGRGVGVSLIGYRGTGKSTVGRLLADALGLPFVDADARLVASEGRPISRIFEESGEPYFRDLEDRTLAEIVAGPPAVVGTGGGAILRDSNRQRLQRFGWVCWLRAEPEELARRLGRDHRSLNSRPALTSAGTIDEIAEMLRQRTPLYQSTSDLAVATDRQSPAEVARALLQDLRNAWGNPLDRQERESSPCS